MRYVQWARDRNIPRRERGWPCSGSRGWCTAKVQIHSGVGPSLWHHVGGMGGKQCSSWLAGLGAACPGALHCGPEAAAIWGAGLVTVAIGRGTLGSMPHQTPSLGYHCHSIIPFLCQGSTCALWLRVWGTVGREICMRHLAYIICGRIPGNASITYTKVFAVNYLLIFFPFSASWISH